MQQDPRYLCEMKGCPHWAVARMVVERRDGSQGWIRICEAHMVASQRQAVERGIPWTDHREKAT